MHSTLQKYGDIQLQLSENMTKKIWLFEPNNNVSRPSLGYGQTSGKYSL